MLTTRIFSTQKSPGFLLAWILLVQFITSLQASKSVIIEGETKCAEWIIGYHGESCTEACSRVSKSCIYSNINAIRNERSFYNMILGSRDTTGVIKNLKSTENIAEFCNAGINAWKFAHAPSFVTVPLWLQNTAVDERAEMIHGHACYIPSDGSALDVPFEEVDGCDVHYRMPAAQRFCSCGSLECARTTRENILSQRRALRAEQAADRPPLHLKGGRDSHQNHHHHRR